MFVIKDHHPSIAKLLSEARNNSESFFDLS